MKQTAQQFLSSLGKKIWNAADRLRYDYYFDLDDFESKEKFGEEIIFNIRSLYAGN